MFRLLFTSVALATLISAQSFGALVLQQYDSAVPAVYANGGMNAGSNFGGTLGNGSISMDVVGANLVVSFTPGGALDNIVAIYMDTRAGGFLDADMDDQADGGRRVISQLTLTQDDTYPATVLPDFGLAIGGFGSVLFELNAGNTNGHLQFQIFNGAPNMVIPLVLLGNPSEIDFFAAYASDSGYNSSESLPRTTAGANQAGNPGFGDGQFGGLLTGAVYDNFNRFTTTAIPEPGTFLVWGLALLSVGFAAKRAQQA